MEELASGSTEEHWHVWVKWREGVGWQWEWMVDGDAGELWNVWAWRHDGVGWQGAWMVDVDWKGKMERESRATSESQESRARGAFPTSDPACGGATD